MSKCINYIFSKSCIFKIYFTYILYIYICQNISDIYLNDAKIYFRFEKLYMSQIYFISMEVSCQLIWKTGFWEKYVIAAIKKKFIRSKICSIKAFG